MLAAEPDSSWFYSSLAQSTASVVGFIGALLIFRFQDYTTTWTQRRREISELQRRWMEARRVRLDRILQDRALDPAVRWDDLRPLLDDQAEAEFPRELDVIIAGLVVLFAAGTAAPLVFLEAPANTAQVLWVSIISGVVLAIALCMRHRSHGVFRSFKNVELWDVTRTEYEMSVEQERAWAEQSAEEARATENPAGSHPPSSD